MRHGHWYDTKLPLEIQWLLPKLPWMQGGMGDWDAICTIRIWIFCDHVICILASFDWFNSKYKTRSSIGRVFRSLLWRWRKMAALPLPVAILDDLISGSRSSKMATGSGRAAIFLHLHNRDRKTRPRFWMTSFPASPSWIQDGGGGNDVRRTSRRSWRRSTDVCPIHESCRSLTLLFSEIKKKIKSIWSLASPRHYPSDWVSCPLTTTRKSTSLHMSKVVKNLRLRQAPTLLFFFFWFYFFFF